MATLPPRDQILGNLLGSAPPFQGNQADQLETTGYFFLYLIVVLLSGYGITYFLRDWAGRNILRLGVSVIFALLIVLTARTAAMASYINYDFTKKLIQMGAFENNPNYTKLLKFIELIKSNTSSRYYSDYNPKTI